VTSESIARFFGVVLPHMNEVQCRVVAGAEAEMLGRGEPALNLMCQTSQRTRLTSR
jgi:hypothetical protein